MRLVSVAVLCLLGTVLANSGSRTNATREPQKEDEVAATLAAARQQAGRDKLTRVRYRPELQQIVCSAAIEGAEPHYPHGVPALSGIKTMNRPTAMYKTDDPAKVAEINDELQRLAAKEQGARFSVAVWSGSRSDKTREYWVGIGVYKGASTEWFERHLTDDVFVRNDWKQVVLPECRGK